jgi:hypothetical protein
MGQRSRVVILEPGESAVFSEAVRNKKETTDKHGYEKNLCSSVFICGSTIGGSLT